MGLNVVDSNVFYSTFTNVFVIFVTFSYVLNVFFNILLFFFQNDILGLQISQSHADPGFEKSLPDFFDR